MSKGHVKRRLGRGLSAIQARRTTALKNIEKHLRADDHSKFPNDLEKHNKEVKTLIDRLA
jgi:hypothetical protein